jgi:hypothetical protein
MPDFQKHFEQYRKLMLQGDLRIAYQSLMQFMSSLRTHFEKQHPDLDVSSAIYPGVMDMTFFTFVDDFLKKRKLKITVVFLHEKCRLEVWLSGANRTVQNKCWKLLKDSGFDAYPLVDQAAGVDSIIAHVIADNPNFTNPAALIRQIEKDALSFSQTVESFLKSHNL